ncbi:hypothetical protein R3P38DRAFT_2387052, partial [Favolaschia claudopus]
LLEAFRLHFHQYHRAVNEAMSNPTDEVVLSRLHDDLQEYSALVVEHAHIFPVEELATVQQNLALMLNDVRIQYQQALDASHHGRPTVVERVHSGRRGRPRIEIDPQFLEFATEHRSITGIGRFLNVSRSTVRARLLEQGLATPQPAPFIDDNPAADSEADDILDPLLPIPENMPEETSIPTASNSADEISSISDWELDSLLLRLRTHFRRAGITMLDGMLHRLG